MNDKNLVSVGNFNQTVNIRKLKGADQVISASDIQFSIGVFVL
jgi:hypothetical protein